MSRYVKKLGTDTTYKRPKVTYQETLTPEKIQKMLEGYVKVDDISEVPLNTHVRYFQKQPDGSQLFRTGGFLHNKTNPEVYVMLSNGQSIWSVNVETATFFRKLSAKEEIKALHNMYQKQLAEKDDIIEKLKTFIRKNLGDEDNIGKISNKYSKFDKKHSSHTK